MADAFFQLIICWFGMPVAIPDQGREFENHLMQELCLLLGTHKTRMTPYHLVSNGLVERFNRTLLMLWAMFVGEHRDDWDDLLPAVMMEYRSSVHELNSFSPYRLMFGEECTLPMDVGLTRHNQESPDALWVRDALEVAYDQVHCHAGQAVRRQKRLYDYEILSTGTKMQTGFTMVRTLFSGVPCWVGHCSATPRFTDTFGSLPRLEENSPSSWFGVVAAI